ncbi:hypothetical protein MMYC01_210565 [Madurella mycetomatis]|uniref:SnoaL-like domain-containing protein n=1 Tax=Madurella mycetomatis TaxID=100816 RepID=A0A175VNE1_9PEZI|nr:hypothetical protein MMYC01_210565 [Madurella mycetomatis]
MSLSASKATTAAQGHPNPPKDFPNTTARLIHLYADITRFSQISSPHIILHPADRDLTSPPRPPVRGIEAVQAHAEALVAATGGTLAMEAESIVADEVFGCVMGVIRAGRDDGDGDCGEGEGKGRRPRGKIAMRFCGVWKFDEEGRAVEHCGNSTIDDAKSALIMSTTASYGIDVSVLNYHDRDVHGQV